jgi:DNA-directed RNA polymerase specialized sigma24 family protein
MLFDDLRARAALRGIVHRLVKDSGSREDLMQVAMIHLWLLEERKPGQTKSWYLQSCKFHLQNRISSGRSIDSPKRQRSMVYSNHGDAFDTAIDDSRPDGSVVGQVSARDMIVLLSNRLPPRDQAILGYLAEGFGARDIARRLRISHCAVVKHRRKIATIAIRLGIVPLPANGKKKASPSLPALQAKLKPRLRLSAVSAIAS